MPMLAILGFPLDDVNQVFVVLAVLYAVECCWWLRGEARRFFRSPFDRLSDRPADSPTVDAWRLSFSNPWPWGEAYAAEPFPIPFDHALLLIPRVDAASGRETYRAVNYESIDTITASGCDVLAGDSRLLGCSSPVFASAVATRLERLRVAPAHARPMAAEDVLSEIWSLEAARRRLDGWRRDARALRCLGGLLAVSGILVGPIVHAWRDALPQQVPLALLVAVSGLWLSTSITGLLVASGPGGRPLDVTHRLIPFLSPASAMRLHDTAGRELLAGHEPLVVALVTGRPDGDQCVAAAWFRDALFPAHRPSVAPDDSRAVAALAWFRGRSGDFARLAVAAAGLDADGLLVPADMDPEILSFCPRCGRQFTVEVTTCLACGHASAPHARP